MRVGDEMRVVIGRQDDPRAASRAAGHLVKYTIRNEIFGAAQGDHRLVIRAIVIDPAVKQAAELTTRIRLESDWAVVEVDTLTRDGVTSRDVYCNRGRGDRVRRVGQAQVAEADALPSMRARHVEDIVVAYLLHELSLPGHSGNHNAYAGRRGDRNGPA